MLFRFQIALLCISIVLALPSAQNTFQLSSNVLVPFQAAVMSQCPDAIACESVLDHVLQQVADKVDFSLIYVAQANSSAPVFGVTCKHGPLECAGNVQQLCAAKYEPFNTWWDFVLCQNARGRYAVGLPEIALQCAASVGIDWKNGPVGRCAGFDGSGRGKEGIQLLQESSEIVKGLGIEKSCTIVINGRSVCIRDDEKWKNCENGHTVEAFVSQIEEEYERLNNDVDL